MLRACVACVRSVGCALRVRRAIHDAVETGMLEMVRVLVEHGADPCTEYLDKTPCEIARSLGHMEIHQYLQGKLLLLLP